MVVNVDTSVALAHVLAEDRRPPESLWQETLITSRLTHYEAAHAPRLARCSTESPSSS
jgi:hypothetical protein